MITKKQLRDELKAKEQTIKELLQVIHDKDEQIVKLLVELGKYYQNEITNQEVNNQN